MTLSIENIKELCSDLLSVQPNGLNIRLKVTQVSGSNFLILPKKTNTIYIVISFSGGGGVKAYNEDGTSYSFNVGGENIPLVCYGLESNTGSVYAYNVLYYEVSVK